MNEAQKMLKERIDRIGKDPIRYGLMADIIYAGYLVFEDNPENAFALWREVAGRFTPALTQDELIYCVELAGRVAGIVAYLDEQGDDRPITVSNDIVTPYLIGTEKIIIKDGTPLPNLDKLLADLSRG